MELEHAIGFDGRASQPLHIHPDGEHIVYVLGGCVVISQLRDAHNQVFLRGHDDRVTCLDVTSSGRLIASGQAGDNADVVVWDYASGQEVYRLQEHDIGVKFVHFSEDERFLLTVGADRKLYVWDMHTGNIVAKTGALKAAPACACWGGRSRDIKGRQTMCYQLATGGEANLTYWVFDPSAGTLTAEECTLGNQVRNFISLAFSPDATYLFAGSSSSDFTAVHVKHKVLHSTTVCGSNGVKVLLAQETREGNDRIIVGCGDGLVAVYEGQRNGAMTCRMYAKGPNEQCCAMLNGGVCALQLHAVDEASGQLRLLAGSAAGSLYAVELSSADYRASSAPPASSRVLQQAHYDKVVAVAYAKDSSDNFATASADGTVRVWDVNDYSVISAGSCQVSVTGEPLCLDFSGEVSFVGWEDGRIRAFDADTGSELWYIDSAHNGGCTALVVSNNRKFLVSGGAAGEVRVWEIRTRDMVVNLKQHTMPVTSLQLEPDDSHVYSSSRDKTILMWDLRAEARKMTMSQNMGGINAIAYLPGSTELLSVGQEKQVISWDVRESQPVGTVSAAGMGEQTCIALTMPMGEPKFTIFATAGMGDCRVRLWRYGAPGAAPTLLQSSNGHSSPVRALKFSPDSKQLVSVAEDGAVLMWNIFFEEFFPEYIQAPPASE